MGSPAEHHLSYAAYLALEEDTRLRHEFLDGRAWAMSGGTPRHAAIAANAVGALWQRLAGTPCRPYGADLRIRVPGSGLATYADALVVCGELEAPPEDPHAATNPVVVIEVLSPSTEAWDRGAKWAHYRSLPSLRGYVLVSQDEPRAEVFLRQEDGSWRYAAYGEGEAVPTGIDGLELPVDVLYRDLPRRAHAG